MIPRVRLPQKPLDWLPREHDGEIRLDVQNSHWEEATIVPSEGHGQTEWITAERDWIVPVEECE